MAISKKHFFGYKRNCYCSNPEQIQNYDLAIADKENIWVCHHKLEAWFTVKELKDMGRYYNVPARELIFVKTQKEHMNLLHCMMGRSFCSKLISEKTKEAMAKIDKKPLIESGKKAGKHTKETAFEYKKYKSNGGTVSWNNFQRGIR